VLAFSAYGVTFAVADTPTPPTIDLRLYTA
jgi:hypothetical protein